MLEWTLLLQQIHCVWFPSSLEHLLKRGDKTYLLVPHSVIPVLVFVLFVFFWVVLSSSKDDRRLGVCETTEKEPYMAVEGDETGFLT